MTYKRFFCWTIILGWLALSASVPAVAKTLSLKQSVDYGLTHSPLLQGAAIRVNQAEVQIKSERGRFLPNLSTGYSYNKLKNISASGPADTDYIDQTQGTGSVSIRQTLFAGFEYKSRFERAKFEKLYEKARLDMQKLDLRLQITETFFELLKIRQDIFYISKTIQRLESDLAAAKSFNAKQMAPYVHVLQADADLEEARQQLWQTQTTEKRLTSTLKRLIGMDQEIGNASAEKIIFDDKLDLPGFQQTGELSVSIDKALKNRPEIKLLLTELKMADADSQVAISAYYPRVTLDMNLYDFDKKYDNLSKANQKNRYWKTGVNVSWNLFDGGTAYYKNQKSQLEKRRLKTEIRQATLEIKEEVNISVNELEETRKRLDSVKRALYAAQENYDREKTRFQARLSTTSRVLEAQARLARAEARRSQSLLDFQVSMARLSHAMGSYDSKE